MPDNGRDDNAITTHRVISSKNMELDSKMGGGLPVGCLTLIEGVSGSGKSVLSQQIAFGALQDGYRVSLFTSENTVKSLMKQMGSIDLDVLDFLLLAGLVIVLIGVPVYFIWRGVAGDTARNTE